MILRPPEPAPAAASTPWDCFCNLLPAALLDQLDPQAAQTVYLPSVVTWLLIYQRLHGNASLAEAVAELTLRFPPQFLPEQKRSRQAHLSLNTGAYSQARTRLDCQVLRWASDHLFDSLLDTYPPSWRGRRAFILDGSTLQLTNKPALQAAYPPASNQHGTSPWPILHLAVAHELSSGLALRPEFGPMYGPKAQSELALARKLLPRLPAHSILLADRNFGIFAFAHAAVAAGHDILLRLTAPRFRSLRKRAQPAGPGCWKLAWRPTRHDRKQHPDLPADAELQVWLHEVKVSEKVTLWLVTTLEGSGADLAALYGLRQGVETDIGNVKRTMVLEELRGQSVDMVEKELLAGVLAYNLVNQVRQVAATQLDLPPRRLSFTGIWSLLKAFLGGLAGLHTEAEVQAKFERLLRGAAQRKLPQRPQGRSYPREVLPRRRKFPVRKKAKPSPTP
jgi:hypothetical protein